MYVFPCSIYCRARTLLQRVKYAYKRVVMLVRAKYRERDTYKGFVNATTKQFLA